MHETNIQMHYCTYRFSPKLLAPSPALLIELLPSLLAVISSSVKMSSCASSFSVDNKPEIMASSSVTFNANQYFFPTSMLLPAAAAAPQVLT